MPNKEFDLYFYEYPCLIDYFMKSFHKKLPNVKIEKIEIDISLFKDIDEYYYTLNLYFKDLKSISIFNKEVLKGNFIDLSEDTNLLEMRVILQYFLPYILAIWHKDYYYKLFTEKYGFLPIEEEENRVAFITTVLFNTIRSNIEDGITCVEIPTLIGDPI